MKYAVFVRRWWKRAERPGYPRNLQPSPGRKMRKGHPQRCTEAQALDYCRAWNANHAPGRYSRKAEFEVAQ